MNKLLLNLFKSTRSGRDKLFIIISLLLLLNIYTPLLSPFVYSSKVLIDSLLITGSLGLIFCNIFYGCQRLLTIRIAIIICWFISSYYCYMENFLETTEQIKYFDIVILLNLYLYLSSKIDYQLIPIKKTTPRHWTHAENLSLLFTFIIVCLISFQLLWPQELPSHQQLIQVLSILLIMSPSSIYYACKLPLLSAIQQMVKQQLPLQQSSAIYQLHQIDRVIFNSSQIFHKGLPAVKKLVVLDNFNKAEILNFVLSLEQKHLNPIGQTLSNYAQQHNSSAYHNIEMFQIIDGFGLRAKCLDKWLLIGSKLFMEKSHIKLPQNLDIEQQTITESFIFIAYDEQLIGYFILHHTLKPALQSTLSMLNRYQIQSELLTSQNETKTKSIIQKLPLNKIKPELLQHQKQRYLQSMVDGGHHIAVIDKDLIMKLITKNKITTKIRLSNLAELQPMLAIIQHMRSKQTKLLIGAFGYQCFALILTLSQYFSPLLSRTLMPIITAIALSSLSTLAIFMASRWGGQSSKIKQEYAQYL